MVYDQTMTHHSHLLTAAHPTPALYDFIVKRGTIDIPVSTASSAANYLTRAIVGQQLSVKAAATIWQRLQDAAANTPFPAFFVPENAERLRACGLSYSKIRAASAVHTHFKDHKLDDASLAAMPAADRSRHLCQIWGIGAWTCDMLSLFYFRDPDVWAVGDGGLIRAVGNLTATTKPTLAQMQDFSAPFAPYRSILSLYLWRMLDNEPAQPPAPNP